MRDPLTDFKCRSLEVNKISTLTNAAGVCRAVTLGEPADVVSLGTHIITGSSDKTVTIWDPKAGKIFRMLKGHQDTVKSCVFSPTQQDNGITVAASAGRWLVQLSCLVSSPNLKAWHPCM
jgi:WD40 repeat protein